MAVIAAVTDYRRPVEKTRTQRDFSVRRSAARSMPVLPGAHVRYMSDLLDSMLSRVCAEAYTRQAPGGNMATSTDAQTLFMHVQRNGGVIGSSAEHPVTLVMSQHTKASTVPDTDQRLRNENGRSHSTRPL